VPLLPYLPLEKHEDDYYFPQDILYWEMCPGEGKLMHHLMDAGLKVVWDLVGLDALTEEPKDYDIIITNPPYSNKHEWLQRAVELDKPFAILLPVTTLGVRRCQIWMDDVDVLFLPKRIDFTGKKAPWFAVAWFTRRLLPDKMIFATGAQ